MTLKQFMTKAKAKGTWRIVFNGRIRDHDGCCPIEAVGAGQPYTSVESTRAIGLSRLMANDIMSAADNCIFNARSQRIREEMESWTK
jgi:hypothetical protein